MDGKIVIMGAMEDVELDILKMKMNFKSEYSEKRYHFYEGILAGKNIVLVETGIGTINAAITTTIVMIIGIGNKIHNFFSQIGSFGFK